MRSSPLLYYRTTKALLHHSMSRIFLLLYVWLMAMAVSAKDFTVVIDAGHGGKDPGAVSANKQIYEKDITLKVALMVGESIAASHPEVKVLYTRKTDKFVGLNDRARMANKANADLFISIHVNAAKNRSAKGAETFTLGVEEKRTELSLDVAKRENGVILLEDNHEKTYANFNPNSFSALSIAELSAAPVESNSGSSFTTSIIFDIFMRLLLLL